MGEDTRWFAIVRTRISGGNVYVTGCERFAAAPEEVVKRVREIGGAKAYAYMSGSERIALRHLAEAGIMIMPLVAGQNRLWRTEHTLRHWNAGRILWPTQGHKTAIERFQKFTGGEDEENEEIDALVSVVEGALLWSDAARPEWIGRRRLT